MLALLILCASSQINKSMVCRQFLTLDWTLFNLEIITLKIHINNPIDILEIIKDSKIISQKKFHILWWINTLMKNITTMDQFLRWMHLLKGHITIDHNTKGNNMNKKNIAVLFVKHMCVKVWMHYTSTSSLSINGLVIKDQTLNYR